jgi:MoaA/NifB/PqqE/SkfB family radical SAM enzyme
MGYSVGIGLTNDCNLNCAHCYRDTSQINHINLDQVKQLCASLAVDSMGMGTGENALNPEFIAIVAFLSQQGIKLSLASNGYSLTTIPDETLRSFNDVEVSIDFPTQPEQDAFRGQGNWDLVHRAIQRCQNMGIEVSILSTLMRSNFDQMDKMVALARLNGVNLRVNAYQAVKSDEFRLDYDQFWGGYRRLFAAGLVVSCSEPVVRARMGMGPAHSPCGHNSIRINPRGQVIPCVYWPVEPGEAIRIDNLKGNGENVLASPLFTLARHDPVVAADCPCRGGCASRRALNGQLNAHDDYCPWVRGDLTTLDWKPAPAKDLMRIGNVCTTVVV